MKLYLIMLFNFCYLAVSARVFGFEHLFKPTILGHPDVHGCVMPYQYCNHTDSCEPLNKLCVFKN